MFEFKFNSWFFGFILLLICVIEFSSLQDNLDDNSLTVQNEILNFASKLNKILHWDNLKDENIIFSPLNIYNALLLVHLGSSGKTRDKVNNILGIVDSEDWPGFHEKFNIIFETLIDVGREKSNERNLNITNVIFGNRTILNTKFVSYTRSQYDSHFVKVDFLREAFETVNIINKNIAFTVENRVPQMYTEPLSPNTKIILASCLNLKSSWKFPFRKSTTQRDTFYATTGSITLNMMQRVGSMPYANMPSLGAEIGKLFTNNINISLFVVLPYKRHSLRYFLDNVTPDDIKQMVSSVVQTTFVDFKLPRIVLKWYKNLNEPLSELQAGEVFFREANFSNMMDKKYNYDASEIKYVADVKISEQGIEMSSVASVKIASSPVIESSSNFYELNNSEVIFLDYIRQRFSRLEFHVNRPFFVFIYNHDVKSVLFFGTVNNPVGARY